MTAQTNFEFKYRIVYESLSRFSSNLSKCNSYESVAQCLRADVKYIIDFGLLRFTFLQPDLTVNYTICNNECSFAKNDKEFLWDKHELICDNKTPTVFEADELYIEYLRQKNVRLNESPKFVWNWNYYVNNNSGLVITLITTERKVFYKSDIPVLKLVAENLYSKLISLKLVNDLDVKKNELEVAFTQLREIHDTLKTVVSRQDLLIEDRTAELKDKNRKLLELSKMNAHNVREPLSRILGILSIVDDCDMEEIMDKWLPMVFISARDLDKALCEVIKIVDTQIKESKNYD